MLRRALAASAIVAASLFAPCPLAGPIAGVCAAGVGNYGGIAGASGPFIGVSGGPGSPGAYTSFGAWSSACDANERIAPFP